MTHDYPFISCIMPTSGKRTRLALHAVDLFLAQDYPHKELIVIDEATKDEDFAFSACFTRPGVRVINVWDDAPLTIGAKRNVACSLARGDVICQWDDDDYYGPHRLSVQVQPLVEGKTELTGLRTGAIVDIDHWHAWTLSDALHTLMFRGDVHGGTLMYWKRLWKNAAYPDSSRGEDAEFIRRTLSPVYQVANNGGFVYIRHGKNAWDVAIGTHIQREGWQRVEIGQYLPPEEQAFYAGIVKEGIVHGSR